MAEGQLHHDEADPSRGELDQLNFDHHREERHRLMGTSRTHTERSSSDDRRQDAERIEALDASRPLESRSGTAARSGDSDTRRSRARTK